MTADSQETPLAYGLPLLTHVKPHAPIINTIGDAAEFLREDLAEQDTNKFHWRVAVAAVSRAISDPTLIRYATEAMRNALETDGLMITSPPPVAPAREQRTAGELADMVKNQINVRGVAVAVYEDSVYGWHPTVIAAPAQAVTVQHLAEAIARVLRKQYDLAK
jgi:hypothetical protein